MESKSEDSKAMQSPAEVTRPRIHQALSPAFAGRHRESEHPVTPASSTRRKTTGGGAAAGTGRAIFVTPEPLKGNDDHRAKRRKSSSSIISIRRNISDELQSPSPAPKTLSHSALVAVEVVGLDGTRKSVTNVDLRWTVDDLLRFLLLTKPDYGNTSCSSIPSTSQQLVLTTEDGKELDDAQSLTDVIGVMSSAVYLKHHSSSLLSAAPAVATADYYSATAAHHSSSISGLGKDGASSPSPSIVERDILATVREIIRRPLWKDVDDVGNHGDDDNYTTATAATPGSKAPYKLGYEHTAATVTPSKAEVRRSIEKTRRSHAGPKLLTQTVSVRKLLNRNPKVVFGGGGASSSSIKKLRFTYVRPYGETARLDN